MTRGRSCRAGRIDRIGHGHRHRIGYGHDRADDPDDGRPIDDRRMDYRRMHDRRPHDRRMNNRRPDHWGTHHRWMYDGWMNDPSHFLHDRRFALGDDRRARIRLADRHRGFVFIDNGRIGVRTMHSPVYRFLARHGNMLRFGNAARLMFEIG
ncbi:hypothetical protein GCM10007854_18550 [Algimonas porphyrae]|uniref:Uncharacterized protein n=1 Tax=Algimonas porphyrae TaxID=1128113 RepID=A0ABQ5V2K9_9PROT|nr:hypothetical protein GCM10007854_18550 [Algimonas porphyrae]